MRTRLVLLAVLALVAAGCGGKKTTFTNPMDKYNGTPVDIVGQVYLVYRDDPGAIWFAVYADVKDLAGKTLVKYPDPNFMVDENQLVHVAGVVNNDLQTPDMIMWDPDPVVLASKATVVTQPSG